MNEELYRNKLHIESPTSISLGHITWFGLDTKMVGRIKALIEELEFEKATNKELLSTGADLENKLYEEQDKRIELENIIKEAINYIDDNTYYKDHKGHINIDDLYIILQKGSEKE